MLLRILLAAVMVAWLPPVYAKDNGQWSDTPSHIREWFKSVKGRNGIPCCDISDGHRTEYAVKDNAFWVPIDGVWVRVPDWAVILDSGNPTGDAVVWLMVTDGKAMIRCFVPGSLS